jgi:hypothetical protein
MIVVPVPQQPPPQARKRVLPRPGSGTRVTANAIGAVFSGPAPAASWDHPWRPHQQLRGVSFTVALVQSLHGDGPLIPTIKVDGSQVPMNGKGGQTPPVMSLDPSVADSDGVSFAVLEVEPDMQGELRKTSRIEIVHSLQTNSTDSKLGRKALLQFLWKNKAVFHIQPCVHFNLVYQRELPTPGTTGAGAPQHLFL